MPKMPKKPTDPTSQKVILGKSTFKEVGKKVERKGKSVAQIRQEMRDKFLAET